MRVLIATVQVPFLYGGAEFLAQGLLGALRTAGHEAEIVAIPFQCQPPERILDHMLACRLLDLNHIGGKPVDRLICLKFPAYLIPHPCKVLWILHQHRPAYDLWDHSFAGDLVQCPNGAQIRDAIWKADTRLITEAQAIFTISANVSRRLKNYCCIDSTPIYPPPLNADRFYCALSGDYFFFPSRISQLKRQALVLEALSETQRPVRVRFAGRADDPCYGEALRERARRLNVWDRVEWLGEISEKEKCEQYAHSLGVVYPPVDEDFGFVTLEAMLSSKPVITCTDSGGPLELVCSGSTGLLAEPNPSALARAMDELWHDRSQAEDLGQAGLAAVQRLGISWSDTVQRLIS